MAVNGLYNFVFNRMDGLVELRKGLDAYSLRQKAQAANIANSETPNYVARKVVFEEQLAKALNRRGGGLTRTNPEHIPVQEGLSDLQRVEPHVVLSDGPKINGINNVDIDREIADMATNQMQYAMASKALSIRYKMLKSAIMGRSLGG